MGLAKMHTKFSRLIAKIITIACLVGAGVALAARADTIQVREDAPSRYVVKKGDTLWDISATFLKDPWRWPEVWGMNKAEIKNPHLIYPGDQIFLSFRDGQPILSLERDPGNENLIKLSPRVRSAQLDAAAIPSIPPSAIEPFLTRPLVVDETQLSSSPVIVATEENRVLVGEGNVAYVEGVGARDPSEWFVYRPGRVLRDPESRDILGYEAMYLGDVVVTRPGNPATVQIANSVMEINKRDRLVPGQQEQVFAYVPHAPSKPLRGRILSAYGAVAELAWGQIVSINKGARDGLERGHVLATYRKGEHVRSILNEGRGIIRNTATLELPDERTGLIFVFRTFDRIAYGLVVNSTAPLYVGDSVRTPE